MSKPGNDDAKDAARYRFIKENNTREVPQTFCLFWDDENQNLIPVENMDAEIDTVMEAKAEGKSLQDAWADAAPVTEQREPAAWLDPDAGKAITAAEKEAADTRHARWQHSYAVPLYR